MFLKEMSLSHTFAFIPGYPSLLRVRSRPVPGRKGPGRPKKTWDECVKQDLKVCVVYLRPALRIECRGDHLWRTVDRSLLTGALLRAWLRLRHGAFWGCAPAPLTKLDLIDWLIPGPVGTRGGCDGYAPRSLQWRHNGPDGVSNHRRLDCVLNRLFKRRSKTTSKLRATDLCEGNSPVTGEFPTQRASNAENISTWWSHHGIFDLVCIHIQSRGQSSLSRHLTVEKHGPKPYICSRNMVYSLCISNEIGYIFNRIIDYFLYISRKIGASKSGFHICEDCMPFFRTQ